MILAADCDLLLSIAGKPLGLSIVPMYTTILLTSSDDNIETFYEDLEQAKVQSRQPELLMQK